MGSTRRLGSGHCGHHHGHHGHHLGHHGHHHGPVIGQAVGPGSIDHGLTKTCIITQRSHCTTLGRARNARMHPASREHGIRLLSAGKLVRTKFQSSPLGTRHLQPTFEFANCTCIFCCILHTYLPGFNRHQHKLQTCYWHGHHFLAPPYFNPTFPAN